MTATTMHADNVLPELASAAVLTLQRGLQNSTMGAWTYTAASPGANASSTTANATPGFASSTVAVTVTVTVTVRILPASGDTVTATN
jgi:hypothetical protein